MLTKVGLMNIYNVKMQERLEGKKYMEVYLGIDMQERVL